VDGLQVLEIREINVVHCARETLRLWLVFVSARQILRDFVHFCVFTIKSMGWNAQAARARRGGHHKIIRVTIDLETARLAQTCRDRTDQAREPLAAFFDDERRLRISCSPWRTRFHSPLGRTGAKGSATCARTARASCFRCSRAPAMVYPSE